MKFHFDKIAQDPDCGFWRELMVEARLGIEPTYKGFAVVGADSTPRDALNPEQWAFSMSQFMSRVRVFEE